MKYMIIAGETSGDLHAAGLIKHIRSIDPEAEFRFFGGDEMVREAGHDPVVHCDAMNVMGFSAVLKSLPRIASHLRRARRLMAEFRPDRLVLVDYPSFNLRLARHARKSGVPVHWFIAPKIWAWKEWRIKGIRKYVDRMYSILPFEVDYFRRKHYEVTYVGNPSVTEMNCVIQHLPSLEHFLGRQGIDDRRPVIALIPGSRYSEVRNNLPFMLRAAMQFNEFQIIVGGAPSIPLRFYREVAQQPGLQVIFGATHILMKHARAALVTSGTATLETALLGTPQVVCYRANGSKLSYKIMEKLLKVRYVSLPNLIVGRGIVPELLVHRCTVESITACLSPLLQPSPAHDRMIAGYRDMRRQLGSEEATATAARMIVGSTFSDKSQESMPE